MTAENHDNAVAFTSHLPHMIAFSFFKMFKEKKLADSKIKKITGGSFRSITRVAKSSPDMWLPIFCENKNNLINLTKEFCACMHEFISNFNNKKNLRKLLQKSTDNEN